MKHKDRTYLEVVDIEPDIDEWAVEHVLEDPRVPVGGQGLEKKLSFPPLETQSNSFILISWFK